MPEFDEVVKQILEDIKSQVCAGTEIVTSLDGAQLSLGQMVLLKNALDGALTCMTRLLDPLVNPSFIPPDAGSDFTPIDTSGFNLTDYARTACEQATKALEEYCDKKTEESARHVRKLNAMMFGYYDAAGLA